MAFNDDIMNFLGTTPEYATPQQVNDLRDYAKHLIPTKDPKINTKAELFSELTRALLGRWAYNSANRMQSEGVEAGLGTMDAPVPRPYSGYPGFGTTPKPTAAVETKTPVVKTASLGPTGYTDKLIQIESGGDPKATTGSYRGLGQFSSDLEQKYGINDSNREEVATQRRAIEQHATENSQIFKSEMGRDPTDGELYLMHQQGPAGAIALLKNPDKPAWQVIRPFYKSDGIAKLAVKGNGGNPDAPAGEFASKWTSKFENGRMNLGGTMPSGEPPIDMEGLPPAGPEQTEIDSVNSVPSNEDVFSPENIGVPGAEAPQQIAQVAPAAPAGKKAFENTFPDPPPANWGLTKQQMRGMQFLPPEMAQVMLQNRAQLYQPIYTEVEGGKRWIVPATGQTGFIGEPKYDKLKVGDVEVPTVMRPSPDNGQYTNPQLLIPGVGGQGGAPGAGGVPGPSGDGSKATLTPISPTPGATPTQGGNLFRPGMKLEDAKTIEDFQEYQRQQSAASKARDFAGTEGAKEVLKPISEAVETGNEAGKTLRLLDAVKSLEALPGTKDMHTGPWAEKILNVNKILTDLGLPQIQSTDANTSAEVLNKIGIILATQATKELTSRPALLEFQKNLEANPNIFLTPDGRRTMVDFISQVSKQNMEIGKLAQKALVGGPDAQLRFSEEKENIFKSKPIKVDYKHLLPKEGTTDVSKSTTIKRKYSPTEGWKN